MAATIRGLVSKNKNRFHDKETGFDLDLTYITRRIIAMGFPSVGAAAYYRNPLPEVQRFFETRHAGHYKIYNLCSERGYELENYFPTTERFPFKDHNPPEMDMILPFCQSVDEYLHAHPENVVAIHCKAGKGRTGMMIAAYLVYCGVCETADEALTYYGKRRTNNGKGVTIPSQMRYVHYFEQLLLRGSPRTLVYQITCIRFVTVPDIDVSGGCDPYFTVSVTNMSLADHKLYDYRDHVPKSKIRKFKPKDCTAELDVTSHNLLICDNVRFDFMDYDITTADENMFHFWLHTGFIESNYLCFEKSMLDKACKDKTNRYFHPMFKVEVFLQVVDMSPEEFTARALA